MGTRLVRAHPQVGDALACCDRCQTAAGRWCSSIHNSTEYWISLPSARSVFTKGRAMLPAMTGEYIEGKPRERSRAQPAGYLMQGADTFSLCEAHHHRA